MAARRFLRAVACAALAAVAAAPSAVSAVNGADPGRAALAARIDGEPLYAFTLDTLWQQKRAGNAALARRQVLDALVTERLLAARAGAASSEQAGASAVAFAPEVALEERLVATLREIYAKDIEAALKALPGATLESLVIAQAPMPPGQAEALFARPGPLLLEIALTPQQQARAGAIEVLRYRLPGGEPAGITLLDVYRRQNVQGRLALSQQPAAVAAVQARRILAGAFVLHWASQRFGAEAVADLRKAIADGEAASRLERLHGIGLDTDSGSPLLNRMSGEVGQEEIEAFYRQHKEAFARIEKVRARHIRVADEAQARRVAKALQAGAGFAETARRMSRAPDAAKGGDLGWISADNSREWLASLAFSQPPGKPSAPVRAPVGPNEPAYWEIVLVEERVDGVHPPRSETVRYQASRMIARDKAVRQLGEMAEQARRSAHVEIVETQ